MRSVVRIVAADVLLFFGAWWLRFGWMAEWGQRHSRIDTGSLRSVRQVYDGHERLLFEAFLGQPPMPSSQAWPASIELHRALGWLTADPRAPLILATFLGALTPVLVGWAVRQRSTLRAGWIAGLLVAVLPQHVAWSTSATPVVHGLACLAGAFAVRPLAWRVVLAGLAASLRPELAVPALFLGIPGGAAVAVAGLQLAVVGAPPGADLWPVVRVNLPLVVFIGPATLGLALLVVRDRVTGLLALAAATVHVVGSTFSDYGSRHALASGIALSALTAFSRGRPWLPVLVGLGGLPTLLDLRAHWLTPDRAPPRTSSPVVSGEGCVEVSDEPPVPGQPRPSWVAWVGGTVDAPCATWGQAPEHTAWSSRGLRDRATRMSTTWALQPVSTFDPGQGRPWRQLWRLEAGPQRRDIVGESAEHDGP